MDNYYHSCPPMMADGGRHLGDYQSATRRNEHLKFLNGIYRDDDYRLFLQKNGLAMMRNNYNHLRNSQSCWMGGQCVHTGPSRATQEQYRAEMAAYNNRNSKCTRGKDYTLATQ